MMARAKKVKDVDINQEKVQAIKKRIESPTEQKKLQLISVIYVGKT